VAEVTNAVASRFCVKHALYAAVALYFSSSF